MNISIDNLIKQYANREIHPQAVLDCVLDRIRVEDPAIWIYVLSREEIAVYVEKLKDKSPETHPLYGIPFAVKDNLDLAGVPTTAACPDYAYTPTNSAYVVQQLIDAGAIPIGKTNLDQFATGLVGTRSPYGIPSNPFDPRYIPGGSSSGSAVAVSKGLVSFALGTDTAGSGRIPASLNNIVGLKPSRGLLSTTGLVPACRSLDCVSIFALSNADAQAVLEVAASYDAEDPYAVSISLQAGSRRQSIGIPKSEQLEFFGDEQTKIVFDKAIDLVRELGYDVVEIDFEPFKDAARLLYEGPWLAERYSVLESILAERPDILHPVTRQIIEQGNRASAVDYFRAEYKLKDLKRLGDEVLEQVDGIMTPTCGTVYTTEQVLNEPLALNSELGYYTNFMNLFDLAAVATPVAFRKDNLPHGVTLFAGSGRDLDLLEIAGELHAKTGLTMGTSKLSPPEVIAESKNLDSLVPIVVCGAHMKDMPLNFQLLERNGRFVRKTETLPMYRLFALEGEPRRPALVRDSMHGSSIAVEVWQLPRETLGSFLEGIGAPLGLGRVFLKGDVECMGFIAEACAVEGSTEITHLQSWRRYMSSLAGS
ncbi:MAG: allophanate hydrolase [Verrucomicrobiota bacterium]